ncbi:hypothetical protein Lfu02_06270 [Longispora fulva]|uniref:Uncharacterized protein n=1 Tax=Longispora fulva TaxID=619741 RepID=A0A8J7GAX6_9ACTN|nr:hypothetical protein [Longispora fulva]MBG6135505.1 hypothetical protein [Longispora fulva]GIG56255.1 hypothetical protein Lfu02_06270 [Longispora fulva]
MSDVAARYTTPPDFEDMGRPDVNFAPEREAPAGASAADLLAAYLGREVH